jgi:hypothetical protein
VRVGTALDLVSALAAGEGLALVGVPVFGVRGPPTEAHDFPAFRASGVIARAEGARRFVLLNGHKEPPLTGTPKGRKRASHWDRVERLRRFGGVFPQNSPRTAGIYIPWGAYWLRMGRRPICLLQGQSRKAAPSFVRIAEPFMR